MAQLSTMTFRGKSGNEYKFEVYPLDQEFNSVGAVYVVTRRYQKDGSYYHNEIYIGQTSDLSERFDAHHKAACFRKNNANCVCVLVDSSAKSRLAKEADLLANHTTPCND